MSKKLLLLLALTLILSAPAGEKRIIGSKAGGNQTLMRVDIVTKIIEYTTNGTDWIQPLLADATTSSAGLMSSADKSKLDGLGSGSATWDSITGKPTVLAQYNGTVSDAGFITLENGVAVADIALGSVVKFTALNSAQGVALNDLYQKKMQSYTPDPAEYDDTTLIVAGAGNSDCNDTYTLTSGSGWSRIWSNGSFNIGNFNSFWTIYPYGNDPGSSALYMSSTNTNEHPWLGTLAPNYGSSPAPTITRTTLNNVTDRLDLFTPVGKEATTAKAGLMSAADKSKLDGISGSGVDLSSYGSSHDGHYTRFAYSSGGIDDKTSACFHFDSSLTDASGHITGATVTGTTAYSAGKFATAFSFDGSSDIVYAKNQSYDGFTSSEKVTCDFWIKTADTSASHAVPMCKNGYDENRFYFYLRNGTLSFEVYESGWVSFAIGTVSDGSWHHIAMTYDGASSVLKTYLDGTLVTSATHSISSSEGDSGFIFGSYGFIGQIDEFRFSKGVIRWSDNFTPPASAYSSSATKALYVDSSPISAIGISSQTASYTLVLSDAGKLVTMSNASANTLTIPLNASVAYPVGTWIDVSCIDAGTCTITAASGVTLNGTDGGTKDLAQWAGTRLYKIAENTWITR